MPEADEDDLLVIRAAPWGLEALQRSVDRQADVDQREGVLPRHGLSVFAATIIDGDIDGAFKRACFAASKYVRGAKVAAVTQQELTRAGYCLHDGYPPECHYLIGGRDLHQPPGDLTALAKLFEHRRPFEWTDPEGNRS